MAQPSYPMRFVLVALAGWINQPQRAVMDYLVPTKKSVVVAAVDVAADDGYASAR
jgi:hypothetical protein